MNRLIGFGLGCFMSFMFLISCEVVYREFGLVGLKLFGIFAFGVFFSVFTR